MCNILDLYYIYYSAYIINYNYIYINLTVINQHGVCTAQTSPSIVRLAGCSSVPFSVGNPNPVENFIER